MTKLTVILMALGTAVVPVLSSTPSHAQAPRTWVSGLGTDGTGCSRSAPCKTFSGALSATAINGEINCIDAGGFGAVTITKSVTIDCHDVFASILASSGTTAVQINLTTDPAVDPLQTVRLRNLNINGTGSCGGNGCGSRSGTNGIVIFKANVVSIEDVLVTDFVNYGLRDQRTTGGRLTVTNSIFRNNSNVGVLINPASGAVPINAVLDNVVSEGNALGIVGANGARLMIKRSVIANNTGNGVESDNIAGMAMVRVDNSVISHNGTGLFTFGGGILRVANSDIFANGTGASGAWSSFGNNRNSDNTVAGTAPTAMGVATHDLGQQ